MKHSFYLLFALLLNTGNICSQNFLLEVKPGISFPNSNQANYSNMKSMPCKVMLGGGIKHFQVGFESIIPIVGPTYTFYDPFLTTEKRAHEEIKEKYYGGFLRYNSASNPQENLGFLLKVGAGRAKATKKIFLLPSEKLYDERDYEPSLDFNMETGLAIPIPKVLFLTIQYGFNLRKYKMLYQDVALEDYTVKSHTIYLGLAVHL